MSQWKSCKSDTTPTRVRFTRPRCFCDHVAAAIYPEPDPLSDPMPLTANWVYECHYTPKQDGMVEPDHCYGCDEEHARALRGRDVGDRDTRERGHSKESDSSFGTPAGYCNPNNIHNNVYNVNHLSPGPNTPRNGWSANSWTSPNGHDGVLHQQRPPLSPSRRPNRTSWADTARLAKAKWGAGAAHHNMARGDQLNILSEVPGDYINDETPDPNSMPESLASASTEWRNTTSRRANNLVKLNYADVSPSFLSTATPVPADTILYPDSSRASGATADRPLTTGVTTNDQLLTESARRGKPLYRVKVCGYHMHAMEWRKMQNIERDDIIVLAERARCPKFNLSITRWLKQGFNHLEMEPFNTVNCYCGNALIVAKDYSRRRYELVCRNRHNQSTLLPSFGQQHQMQPLSNGSNGSLHKIPDSCSMVIPIHKVKYRPLLEPVHWEIRSDDWLSRFFQPPASSLYLNNQKQTVPTVRARMIRLRTLTFKEPVSEIINFPVPPPLLMTSQDFGSDGWFTSKQLEENESTQALKILLGEHDVDISDEVFSRRMDEAGVFEFPLTLVRMAVREGCEDADHYLRASEERMRMDIKRDTGRQGQLDDRLSTAMERHANTVEKIQTMESNAQLLPELKCRVCYERQIKFAILPCHHMVLCIECAQIVESCIVCRGPKNGTLRVDFG
ncbi:hypothetical protein BGX24_011762 [Mortierella sp. AD032]|nr:hypothetical protein BGX24_011762 [Mortierella sp. AD032]